MQGKQTKFMSEESICKLFLDIVVVNTNYTCARAIVIFAFFDGLTKKTAAAHAIAVYAWVACDQTSTMIYCSILGLAVSRRQTSDYRVYGMCGLRDPRSCHGQPLLLLCYIPLYHTSKYHATQTKSYAVVPEQNRKQAVGVVQGWLRRSIYTLPESSSSSSSNARPIYVLYAQGRGPVRAINSGQPTRSQSECYIRLPSERSRFEWFHGKTHGGPNAEFHLIVHKTPGPLRSAMRGRHGVNTLRP